MAMNKISYPSEWKQIRERILARDEHKCKNCGVANGLWVKRLPTGRFRIATDGEIADTINGLAKKKARATCIVLTTAHLGVDYPDGRKGNPRDKMDVRDANLAALCQRCHLIYDVNEHHTTKIRKKEAEQAKRGQLNLFSTLGD